MKIEISYLLDNLDNNDSYHDVIFYSRGLYGGIGIHLMRSVPNAAVMFVTFEVASKWLLAKQIKESNKLENSDDKVILKKLKKKSSAFVTPVHFKINPTSSVLRL